MSVLILFIGIGFLLLEALRIGWQTNEISSIAASFT